MLELAGRRGKKASRTTCHCSYRAHLPNRPQHPSTHMSTYNDLITSFSSTIIGFMLRQMGHAVLGARAKHVRTSRCCELGRLVVWRASG